MTLSVTAYTGIGPGVHNVNVTALDIKTAKAGGDYLRWEFTTEDGKTTSANSSMEMTPGNKTGKWYAALTGRPTTVGEDRQLTEVIGKPATIVVELNPEGFPKVIALTERAAPAKQGKGFGQTNQELLDKQRQLVAQDEALPDELPF